MAQVDRAPAPLLKLIKYPGLLAEFREADLIIKLKVDGFEASSDRDPETQTITDVKISGKVTKTYKDKLNVGDVFKFEMNYADQSRKIQQTGSISHLYFWHAPNKGRSAIFLIRLKPKLQVINVLADFCIIDGYVTASRLKGSDRALALAELYCDMAFDGLQGSPYPYGVPRVLFEDLKLHYRDLDPQSKEFQKLLKKRDKIVFERFSKIRSGSYLIDGFPAAVWLASYMELPQRKRAVQMLLKGYEKINTRLISLRKEQEKGSAGGGAGVSYDPISEHSIMRLILLNSLKLIISPTWHNEIANSGDLATIIPSARWSDRKHNVAAILHNALTFVKTQCDE
jgi:hypothetical protein